MVQETTEYEGFFARCQQTCSYHLRTMLTVKKRLRKIYFGAQNSVITRLSQMQRDQCPSVWTQGNRIFGNFRFSQNFSNENGRLKDWWKPIHKYVSIILVSTWHNFIKLVQKWCINNGLKFLLIKMCICKCGMNLSFVRGKARMGDSRDNMEKRCETVIQSRSLNRRLVWPSKASFCLSNLMLVVSTKLCSNISTLSVSDPMR